MRLYLCNKKQWSDNGKYRNNTFRSKVLGLGLTPTLASTIINNPTSLRHGVSDQLDPATFALVVSAYRQGFRVVFLVGAALCTFSFIIALLLIEQHELKHGNQKVNTIDASRYQTKFA